MFKGAFALVIIVCGFHLGLGQTSGATDVFQVYDGKALDKGEYHFSSWLPKDQERTVVRSPKGKQRLLGPHRLSLQWISWDYFGQATITEDQGQLYLNGKQTARKGTDFMTIDGFITSVDNREFTVRGEIVTQISHINGGKTCTREGEFTFKITGKRKYWRMQQIDNPCDEAADYVDIYLL
jgi:hypothetical protein